MIVAIRQILSGEIYLSAALAERVMSQVIGKERKGASALELLTDRELEVYELVGTGLSTRTIRSGCI